MSVEHIGSRCTGCRACLQKCPCRAITFETDAYGFEYPRIDQALCTQCGLCERVCPSLGQVKGEEVRACGMAYALDPQEKRCGSSGGLFGILAKSVLSEGGVVFGAAFDENLKLKTQKAETEEELRPLYKSKYLLCDTNPAFTEIEKELKGGRVVLYCSSPCQIAALKLFLGKEYDKLLTVDFVCHGVGSQTLFDRSIAYTEEKEKIKIKRVTLRHKMKKGACSHYYEYDYLKHGKPKKRQDLYFSFPYYNAYCKRLACRDSCYDCQYAKKQRMGDITIADFHTIEKYFPEVDRFAGVSMFLVNTEKGQKRFDRVKEKLYWKEMDKEILYKSNRFSNAPMASPHLSAFRHSVANEHFSKTVKRFLRPSKDLLKIIYYKSPKFLRRIFLKFQ